MKHFHLSQGDKQAGLDRPLYLQKKIKSVLTLAPFIGNTCSLVIVLNSFKGARLHHAIELGCTLIFSLARGGHGICKEFLPDSRGSKKGAFFGRAFSGARFGFLPPGGKPLTPYWEKSAPSAPCPESLSGVWGGSKGLTALIEPDRPPSCLGVFAEREMKGWVIFFPRVPDRILRLQGVTQNLSVPRPWAALFKC